jgi:hypothetical protein
MKKDKKTNETVVVERPFGEERSMSIAPSNNAFDT